MNVPALIGTQTKLNNALKLTENGDYTQKMKKIYEKTGHYIKKKWGTHSHCALPPSLQPISLTENGDYIKWGKKIRENRTLYIKIKLGTHSHCALPPSPQPISFTARVVSKFIEHKLTIKWIKKVILSIQLN